MTRARHASNAQTTLFGRRAVLVGMVHLPPLPGAVQNRLSIPQIIEQAVAEAQLLRAAEFDAVLVENFGDRPFFADNVPPHTVAAMCVVVERVCRAVDCPVGVNVLRNDARAAVAIAHTAGARFVRINIHAGVYATDQGLIQGQAADTLRYRRELGAEVLILADVHVKHAKPLLATDLASAAAETAYRALADALIVTGPATGQAVLPEDLATVKHVVPDRPVVVGSGVTVENVREWLEAADGVIVGTGIKHDHRCENRLDPDLVKLLVAAARG